MKASHAKREEEHLTALDSFQGRLQEKRDLLSGYSLEIQRLRREVGELEAAAVAAAEASAHREKELQEQARSQERELAGQLKAAQDASSSLEGELDAARQELRLIDDDNTKKASEIGRLKSECREHKLQAQEARGACTELRARRAGEVAKLKNLADSAVEALRGFYIPLATFGGADLGSYTSFFADFVGRLGGRQVGLAAEQVVGQILSRVYSAHPDFPFDSVFDAWSDEKEAKAHREAVQSVVDEMVARMQGKVDDDEAAAEEVAGEAPDAKDVPDTDAAVPGAPPA